MTQQGPRVSLKCSDYVNAGTKFSFEICILLVVQQLREAWAYKQPHRFLLFDRDAKFGADVVSANDKTKTGTNTTLCLVGYQDELILIAFTAFVP